VLLELAPKESNILEVLRRQHALDSMSIAKVTIVSKIRILPRMASDVAMKLGAWNSKVSPV
jgi:hypothetical protein